MIKYLLIFAFCLMASPVFAQEIQIAEGTQEKMIVAVAKAEKWPLKFPDAKKGNAVIEWEITKDGKIKPSARYGAK